MSAVRPDAIISPGAALAPVASQEWDRQPGESPESWEGFCLYRALPAKDRLYIRVAEQLGKSRQNTERLAGKYHWHARAAAWDAYLERQRDQAEADRLAAEALAVKQEQATTIKQQLSAARALKQQALRIINRESKKPDIPGPDARAVELASKALERATMLERLAVGLPTDVTQQALAQKQLNEETLDLVGQVRQLIAEELCDDCRTRLSALLRRLAQRQRSIAGRLA